MFLNKLYTYKHNNVTKEGQYLSYRTVYYIYIYIYLYNGTYNLRAQIACNDN